MSTTLEIGRWPAAARRCLSHTGDSPICTPSNTRPVNRRQMSGSAISIGMPVARPGLDVALGRVLGQRRAGQRVQVAGHAVDAQRVGAVGVDLELEHLVGDGQVVGQRGAGGPARAARGCPAWSSPIPSSSSARIIPLDLHAAKLGLAQLGAVGHHRSRPRHRHHLARGHVGGAAHDRPRRRRAVLDEAHAQAVGVGVRVGLQHPAHEEARRVAHPDAVDPRDLEPRAREQVGDLAGREPRVAVGPQP